MDGIFSFLAFGVLIAAWLTHLIICLTAKAWGLLIAGALFFPIGIVHGFLSWIGIHFV